MLLSRNFASKSLFILVAFALISLPAFAGTLTATENGAAVTALNFFYTGDPISLTGKSLTISNSTGAVTVKSATLDPASDKGYGGQAVFAVQSSGSTVFVGINTGALTGFSSGSKTGVIHITAGSDTLDLTVTLSMGVSGNVTASPTALTFTSAIGGAQQSQQISLTGPSGIAVSYTASVTDGGTWISVSPASGTTTANPYVTVTVTPSALGSSPTTATGNVRITPSGASPIDTKITLNYGTSTGLVVSPTTLQPFSYTTGGMLPPEQRLYISSGLSTFYSVAISPASSWLLVNGVNQGLGWTPMSTPLTVSVTPASLPTGTYTGNIVITDGMNSFPLGVTLAVNSSTASTVNVSPATLTFSSAVGVAPMAQAITMTTGAAGITYTASVTSGSWLSLSAGAGNVPSSLAVYANPSGLAANVYYGSVLLTFYQNGSAIDTRQVSVSYAVGGGGGTVGTTVAPSILNFSMAAGSTTGLPSQDIAVAGAAGSLYTASSTTSDGAAWLTVSNTSGVMPNRIHVGIDSAVASTLAANNYTGTVNVQVGTLTYPVTVSLKVASGTVLVANPASITVFYNAADGTNPGVQYIGLASSGGTLTYTATSANPGWITLYSGTNSTTPGTVAATLAVGNLPAGVNTGAIQVIATDAGGNAVANSPLTIPVTVVVSGVQSPVSVSPASLSFSTVVGGVPAAQTLTASTTASSAGFTAASNSTWLSVSPTSATATSSTPVSLTVSASTTGLSAGTYNGTITITSGGVAQTVSVTLTVTNVAAATLSVDSPNLSFDYQQGAAAPASRSLSVSSSTAGISFTAASSATWLSVTPANGTTPATTTVAINPQGLAAGTYTGTVTITAPAAGNSPQTRTVTLTVREAASLSASPASLNFLYRTDGGVPSPQTVTVTSSGAALSYSATSNATWLAASPATGTTAGQIAVSINPAGLNPGNYTGQITIATSGATVASSATVNVTLAVSAPLPTVAQVLNAASYQKTPVAPGEIVALFGENMGPADLVTLKVEGSLVARKLSDVRVLFSGIEAPLVYVSARQIAAIVPYALAGKTSTAAQVEYRGVRSNSVMLDVASSAPGLFTANASGSGPGAILNQDYSANEASNPAARGSIVILYATGEGQTIPLGVDGKVQNDASNLSKPVLPVTVTIGGVDAKVLYYGAAPDMVSGVMQINVEVPLASATGDNVAVTFTMGNAATSQTDVTLAVK